VSRHPARMCFHQFDALTQSRGRYPSTEFRYNRCIGGIVMNKVARQRNCHAVQKKGTALKTLARSPGKSLLVA
jgi:hypothetical protein